MFRKRRFERYWMSFGGADELFLLLGTGTK